MDHLLESLGTNLKRKKSKTNFEVEFIIINISL
jgi:hypothetical protein